MSDWTLLCRTMTDTEAELLAGYLEGEGIEVQVESNRFGQYPVNLGLLGDVAVKVRAPQLAAAQELLAKLPQAEEGIGPLDDPDRSE